MAIPSPEVRWFPADEVLRESSYEKLLPPLVHQLRNRGARSGLQIDILRDVKPTHFNLTDNRNLLDLQRNQLQLRPCGRN